MTTNYDSINQPTVDTELIYLRDVDSFFNPVILGHIGFAADGTWYDSGVPNTGRKASWFTEALNTVTRGGNAAFPQPAIAVLSAASLTILDESTPNLDLWMLFLLGDALALPDNFLQRTAGYTPFSLTWANGLLSVVYAPDAGSRDKAVLMLTIDFVKDRVFMDTYV